MINTELRDTPEALFAAGVNLLDEKPQDVAIGWFCETVRFSWPDFDTGMRMDRRVATRDAVMRLASQSWPDLSYWVAECSEHYLPTFEPRRPPKPPKPDYFQRVDESVGQANMRFYRIWAAYQLKLEKWREEHTAPTEDGYRLECRCGAHTARHRDYHTMINAALDAGWAPEAYHGPWKEHLDDLCPECVAYLAERPRVMLTRDMSESSAGEEFACDGDGCGAHVRHRDAIGWKLGWIAPPPPNRKHLWRKQPKPLDLCPKCFASATVHSEALAQP